MSPATQPNAALSPAMAGAAEQQAARRNGSGHESWEHVAPQGKGSMGPPAVPASRSAANAGAGPYGSSAYSAGYALPHERAQGSAYAPPHSAGAHPASKSATGGGSHAHRPVSAMPAPVRSHAPSAMPLDAGVLASMAGGASYNERRASAHPTVSASHTTGAIAPPLPISPSGAGLDATTSNAISSGIPITSPAALSYFAAHPRRQQVHFGSYLLLQTLGEGEFGKVKLGVHKEWGEEVAVKLIKREKVGTPDGQLNINGPKDPAKMSKVEREIQVLKDVRHPNIVRLYEVIESDRYIGIVLEYASGGELFDHILAHKYLKERDACRLFAQLISGVSYLHQKKIVHRDLKLENLLLDRNRNVIITDFGFANNFEDKRDDLMATSCGSPCYAAPELVVQDGLYAGSAVDVWSCGVILYAMLAGYLPFDDDPANPDGDNINLLYKYIMATPLSFPEYISAEPRDLLSKMLVPDPLRRADLNGVMAHSWLAPYRDLFKFGVDELERAAIEQQSKKRQIYRQQMQVQQQLQEQQRQAAAAAARGARGTATPSDASTTKAQRHQSAMATTTASRSEVAYNAPTQPSTRSRPVTGIPTPIAAEPPLPVTPTSMTLTPQMNAGLEDTSFGSIGHRSGAAPSASRKREAVAQDSPSADAYAQKKAPSAQKTQRHTIQLEYDGNSRQEQQRAAANSAAPPVPRVEQRAPEPAMIPATPVVVPSAERVAAVSSESPGSRRPSKSSQQPAEAVASMPTPVPEQAQESAAPSGLAAGSTTAPSLPRVPSTDRATAGNRTASNPTPSAPALPSIPSVSDRIASTGAAPKADSKPLSPASRPVAPAPERTNSRHRKGMSTDNRFFARLLGSPNVDASSGPPPPPSASAAAVALHNEEAAKEGSGSNSRRKAMSLVVGRPGEQSPASREREKAQQASAEKTSKAERRRSTRSRKDTLQRPETPVRSGSIPPASQAASPNGTASIKTQRTSSRISSRVNGAPAGRQGGALFDDRTNDSTSTVGPSSNAAKKVMDWFRKKSLSRGTFDEQPPLGPFEAPPSPAPSAAASTKRAQQAAPQPAAAETSAAPQVVVTEAAATSVPHSNSGGMESVPSSRSTSGTHSQTSEATDATGITSFGDFSVSPGGLKSTGASTVHVHEPPQPSTPRATTPQVNGTPATQATLAPVVPQPAAPAPPPTLRFHLGAVDQSALTSRPPHEVFAEVRRALAEMGVEARKEREEDYKLECVRRKRAKTLIGATQGLGTSIRTSVFPPSQADLQRSTRSPSIGGGGGSGFASASASSGPGGSIRNFLRRGSQQNTSFAAAAEEDAAAAAAAQAPQPLYGEASVDGGQEVRFSVEVTQIKNLAGLYSLDIRRMKGNLWAYKFLYHALLERCELGSGPRRVAA